MKIYYYNGTLWKDVTALDSSFCEETIDRFSRISLDFVLPSEELVPELCHVTWRGEEYTLYTVPKVVKVSTREYRYTLILEGRYKELERTLVKDKLGRTKFVFTGRADQYADLISGCIDGWSTGTCTTGDRTQVIAFSNNTLLEACRMVASKFETEVRLDGGKIAFGRVEKYKGDPLTLAYRQGLQKEITTEPDSKETALGRLYVMGGEHNIDPAKYGSRTLHLPKGGSLSVEGHTFRVDAAGRYISLEGDTRLNTSERALDATTIYPKRVGTISKVEQKGDEWDVIDETNPIDYTQDRVGGDVMRLEFQSGRLAGRSFDLTTKDDKLTGYVHTEKRFRLVRREIDGVLMPESGTFFPAAGDKYAIFGCSLPDEYIKSAEAEMLSTAAKYMAERLETRMQYRAELDGLWAKKNWSTVAHKLTIGTIVRFEGATNDVRISSVRTSLNSPYTPRITFSNAPYMVGSLTTQIATIESAEVRTREETRQSLLSLQARTYEDTKVVREMIERLRVEGFTQAIKPETLQSMYAVIGSPALQFDFVRGGWSVPFSWSEGKGGTITIPGQRIQRKASGTTLQPGDKTTVTDIPALSYTLKAEEQQAYVYTELSPTPHFVISTKPLAISPNRLLVGLLNGEEGKRAFTPLYGFTEITPGQLKTDLIRSQDGKSYWDLLSGKFATTGDLLIGDPKGDTCLAYIDGVLYVKGLTVNVGSSSTTIEDALIEQERKAQKAYDDAVKKAKELDSEIQVGGRNLLLKSDTAYSNTNYRVALYDIADPSQMVEGETYTIRIWGEAEGADFSESLWVYNSGGGTEVASIQQRANGAWTQTFKWRDDRDKSNSYLNIFRGANNQSYDKGSKTTITHVKLERGTVATGWTPAPEDVQAEIDAAKEQATKAQTSTDKLRGYVDGAFRDGVVDDAEAKAIKTYINEVDAQWQSALGAYEKVYQNPLLTGAPKTALLDCKTTLAGKVSDLTDYITSAIADGRATTAEVDGVNSRYNAYKGALRDFQRALKTAEEAIRDSGKTTGGRNLLRYSRIDNGIAHIFVIDYDEISPREDAHTYTLSFDYWLAVDDPATNRGVSVANGGLVYDRDVVADSQWHHKAYTFDLPTEKEKYPLTRNWLTDYGSANGRTEDQAKVRNVKLERGTVATDWTPALEDVQAEIDAERSARETAVREVATGLSSANTLIQSLEQAQDLKLDRDEMPEIGYLLAALKKPKGTTVAGGLLLSNQIILSDAEDDIISATLSGQRAKGAKSLRLGIDYADGKDAGTEQTALCNDGTGHLGDLYFGGEEIGFGDKDSRYMQIGGTARSEYDMVNASTVIRKFGISGGTVRKSGTFVLDRFDSRYSNREIKYTANLSAWAEARAYRVPDNGGWDPNDHRYHKPEYEEFVRTESSATVQLRLELRRGGSTIKTVTSPQVSVRVSAQGGQFGINEEIPQSALYAEDRKSQDVTITISPSDVREQDTVTLSLVTTIRRSCYHHQGSEEIDRYASATASAGSIINFLPYDTSQPMVSVTKDSAAFFYGRSKYVLLNYLQSYVMKVVGNMLLQGNLTLKGDLTAEYADFPGVPLIGGMVTKEGTFKKSFGRYKNQSGGNITRASYDYSTKVYTVYHSIGNDKYIPVLTPMEHRWGDTLSISNVSSYSFQVQLTNGNQDRNQCAFTYVCFKAD